MACYSDCGDDATEPSVRGARVYSSNGREFGVSLGVTGEYHGAAGYSTRITVRWPDGERTRCNVRGIIWKNNRWQIAG